MDIVLTYTTALEAMRLEEFPDLVARWGERTGVIPERLPSRDELLAAIAASDLLQKLTTPLHLLVSTDRTSHSCPLFVRHVTRRPHPERAFVRIGKNLLVASPELLCLQMSRDMSTGELAQLMNELLGTYAQGSEARGAIERVTPLMTKEDVRQLLLEMPGAYGCTCVREALPLAREGLGTPDESRLALMLQAPRRIGSYGLRVAQPSDDQSLAALGIHLDELGLRRPTLVILRRASRHDRRHTTIRGIAVECMARAPGGTDAPDGDALRASVLLAHGLGLRAIDPEGLDCPSRLDDFVEQIRADLGMTSRTR